MALSHVKKYSEGRFPISYFLFIYVVKIFVHKLRIFLNQKWSLKRLPHPRPKCCHLVHMLYVSYKKHSENDHNLLFKIIEE